MVSNILGHPVVCIYLVKKKRTHATPVWETFEFTPISCKMRLVSTNVSYIKGEQTVLTISLINGTYI